tara:strand:+ start:35146 stop:35343 length:198 start_codon:yes stop_codon:yes gene_type:complete
LKIAKPINPGPLRQQQYDSIGDQLDRITKTFSYLKTQGVDIGPDGIEQVDHCDQIKRKHPKKGTK